MREWLKKHIYPNPDNDHRPHLLRKDGVIFALWIIFFVELVYLVPVLGGINRSDFFSAILPSVLIDSANNERDDVSLGRLTYNPVLAEAARLKAEDMASKGYFAHISPDGVEPWYWLRKAGYTYSSAGENLAVNFVNSEDIHLAWMKSEGHRANILDDRYSEVGIATATGEYKGRQSVFVVQFFGRPAKRTIVAQAPAAIEHQSVAEEASGEQDVAGTSAEVSFVEVMEPIEPHPVMTEQSNFIERLAVNPKTIFSDLFVLFFLLTSAAIVLSMATQHELRHYPSMLNGLAIVVFIVAVMLLNQNISVLSASIY